MSSRDLNTGLQWGSEIRKHLKSRLFESRISNDRALAMATALEVESENNGDLKSQLVWILNGQKEVGVQMVPISNGI